jgi:nucleoside-diphosphate-sugar epimerase
MKILLVGSGSALATCLLPILRQHAEVMTAGRGDQDVHIDLGDPRECMVVPAGYDVLINLAAFIGSKTPQDMLRAQEINVLGPLRLAQAAAQAGIGKFVQISSIYAILPPQSPFFSAYALTKRHGDEALDCLCGALNLPLLSLRPSPLYGNDASFSKNQPFLYGLMERAQQHQDITLYGNRDALRNFLHADDLAQTLVAALHRDVRGIYACTHPDNVRLSHIANAAIAAFASCSQVVRLSDKPDVLDNGFTYDNALALACGFTPRISIEEGMRRIAARRQQTE